MDRYWLKPFADSTLVDNLDSLVARGRSNTADVLAHIGEIESRRIYAPMGYPSMFAYCMQRLRFSEAETARRLYAARAARRFPVLFHAVADGRLHLTAVVLLSKRLNAKNVDALIAMATHKTRAEIEKALAARYPKPAVQDLVRANRVPASASPSISTGSETPKLDDSNALQLEHAPAHVQIETAKNPQTAGDSSLLAADVRTVDAIQPPSKIAPLSARTYHVQFTADQVTHDTMREVQELLPGVDLNQMFGRGLQLLLAELRKRKFAATERPHRTNKPCTQPRTIPAEVRRAVSARDGERCTFVSADGRRCESRRVEFDHIVPLARGGSSTVSNLRLRCRAHNQLEAETVFGREFMRRRRDARVLEMASRRSQGETAAPTPPA